MGQKLTLGERIALLRRVRGWTQMELAINLGTDKTYVSRIETNSVKTIKSDTLIKLSQLFKVSADFILGITDDSPFEDKQLTALYEAERAELEAEYEARKKGTKRD
jgi:transcriptional regulator with XRE-family HTH domain